MGIDLFRKIKNAFNLKSLLESEVSDLTDKLQKTDFNSIPSFRILNIDGLRHQKNKNFNYWTAWVSGWWLLYVMNRKKSAELCILNNWTNMRLHESKYTKAELECICLSVFAFQGNYSKYKVQHQFTIRYIFYTLSLGISWFVFISLTQ